jgi:tetratricopeptide (TPR) repeat protein
MAGSQTFARRAVALILTGLALALLIHRAGAQGAGRRVALVIGQNAYPGGASATIGLPELDNPVRDARRMAELLGRHGFEVMSCDGKRPGCLDLSRNGLLDALKRLQERAAGADLALVFFAGHGMATEEGNILAPVDAKVDCASGAVSQGVPVEQIMAATGRARMKLVILDACRDNPLDEVCPSLKGKKLSFTRIEAGAIQGFLLVTSTQFGQQALDGPKGAHSPFAAALFSALEANPNIYFEQVMNEVARATYDATQKPSGLLQPSFVQIPGKVVGGAAPADCLAGKDCIGDARMAALVIENERLAADAAGVRTILEKEERARGRPYTAEERAKRVAELNEVLASIGASTDPLRQEARREIAEGNLAGGQAKLDAALDADEKVIAGAEPVPAEKRKAAAQSARDLAVLASGTDIAKSVAYYQRATELNPTDPQTWDDYTRAAQGLRVLSELVNLGVTTRDAIRAKERRSAPIAAPVATDAGTAPGRPPAAAPKASAQRKPDEDNAKRAKCQQMASQYNAYARTAGAPGTMPQLFSMYQFLQCNCGWPPSPQLPPCPR